MTPKRELLLAVCFSRGIFPPSCAVGASGFTLASCIYYNGMTPKRELLLAVCFSRGVFPPSCAVGASGFTLASCLYTGDLPPKRHFLLQHFFFPILGVWILI
jgi:hypothetical protein